MHPTYITVGFEEGDFKTWEANIRNLSGVRRYDAMWPKDGKESKRKLKTVIEIPSTHFWMDLDNFEMSWFFYDRCVARKKFKVPFLLQVPVKWAVTRGIRTLEKGKAASKAEIRGNADNIENEENGTLCDEEAERTDER